MVAVAACETWSCFSIEKAECMMASEMPWEVYSFALSAVETVVGVFAAAVAAAAGDVSVVDTAQKRADVEDCR